MLYVLHSTDADGSCRPLGNHCSRKRYTYCLYLVASVKLLSEVLLRALSLSHGNHCSRKRYTYSLYHFASVKLLVCVCVCERERERECVRVVCVCAGVRVRVHAGAELRCIEFDGATSVCSRGSVRQSLRA